MNTILLLLVLVASGAIWFFIKSPLDKIALIALWALYLLYEGISLLNYINNGSFLVKTITGIVAILVIFFIVKKYQGGAR